MWKTKHSKKFSRCPLQDGLRLLARREHSTSELSRKLLLRGHATDVVEATLGTLKDQGYLSDGRALEAFIRASLNKGYGPVKILSIAPGKGFCPSDVSAHQAFLQAPWADIIKKQFCKLPPDASYKRLVSRGFPYRLIQDTLKDEAP